MSNSNLNEDLKDSFDKLCLNLFSILNETENILHLEKQRYEQVKSVCNPWPIKRRKSIENINSEVTCTCKNTKTDISQPSTSTNYDSSLVDSIPNIVSKTKALRINPSKTNIRFSEAKKTIKDVISSKGKPESISVKSSKSNIRMKLNKSGTSIGTTTSKNVSIDSSQTHSPSCKLYSLGSSKISTKSSSTHTSLSEAITAYGVPSALQRTLEDYHSFVLDRDKYNEITRKARNSFMKNLNRQNEETWIVASNQIEKLPQYLSVVCAIQEKIKKENELPCIIYHNINELVQYENGKFKQQENEMWTKILKYINKEMIPILINTELSTIEKIFISKMLKTVCNFSKCRVPNVPVYTID